MAAFQTPAPRLAGITIALPKASEENASLVKYFEERVVKDIIRSTGIERRPTATTETVCDLGQAAAAHLLERLGWSPTSVGAIIVITQTPDYPLPATACLLQKALGLETTTLALDISLGCSGYVYGLCTINGLMQTAGIQRALLVCGDISSRMIDPNDRSLHPLFGDAVAVTALELAGGHMSVDLGSDGSGAPYLISPTGGLKQPGPPRLSMDGVQVMAFSLKRVAPSVNAVLKIAATSIDAIDAVVFHQANEMMLKTLGRKVGAKAEQLVLAVKDFGNTSSASIPVALCHWLRESRPNPPSSVNLKLLLSGFGVGWSWATTLWSTPQPTVADMIRMP
jgi:3-oxoacyl-[acyl-carrier-protein] synthase-3